MVLLNHKEIKQRIMKNKKPLDATLSLRLPTYLHKMLKKESERSYKSVNLLIIEAIQDYLPNK